MSSATAQTPSGLPSSPNGALDGAGSVKPPRPAGSSSKPPSPPAQAGSQFLARVREPANLIRILLLTGACIWLFWTWLVTQNHWSMSSGDWSHAYFVPVICLYLLWQHRHKLDKLRATIFWPGVAPMLMGIWSYVFFIVGVPNHLGQGLAMTLTVFGLALLLLGPRFMTYLFFPIAYLFFAITIPEKIMNHVTWPLQNLAARGGWIGLRILGVQTDIAGNQLTVIHPTTFKMLPLNVAEACSGMRMLIAFMALGTAVALVATKMWWKRIVLIGLAAPVAVLLNVVRIVVLGLASLANANLSTGEAHTFIGTLLLIPGFILYMLILLALHKAVPESDEPAKSANKTTKKVSGPRSAPA